MRRQTRGESRQGPEAQPSSGQAEAKGAKVAKAARQKGKGNRRGIDLRVSVTVKGCDPEEAWPIQAQAWTGWGFGPGLGGQHCHIIGGLRAMVRLGPAESILIIP